MPVHHQDQEFKSGGGGDSGLIDKALKNFQEDGHVPDCMIWKDDKKQPELHRMVRQYDPETQREVVSKEKYVPRPFQSSAGTRQSLESLCPRTNAPSSTTEPKKMEAGVADAMILVAHHAERDTDEDLRATA